MLTNECSSFPTSPIVARQSPKTFLTSPDFSLKIMYLPVSSLPKIWADEPADLAIIPPCFGWSSMLCTYVPSGIFLSGNELPIWTSTDSPEMTCWPNLIPLGLKMYLFSPSLYTTNEILAERLGSYSIVLIVPKISSLFLLKSMIR